ncbi:MAG: N-acetyl-gamma-glutamyl-phosphate reductase, partial [Microlunatus sp.]
MKTSILGGAGYIGGELLRLLLAHPYMEIKQITSDSLSGKPVTIAHPNLRGRTELSFTPHDSLDECDVLFLACPHGYSMRNIEMCKSIAPTIIDLSADFRIRNPRLFEQYYGEPHCAPDLLSDVVQGMPEIHRRALAEASLIAVPGCMATPALLALHPFASEELLE